MLDVAVFQLLYTVLGAEAVPAKLAAALASTAVAFLGHRTVTYGRRPRTGLRRESLLFGLVNGLTILLGLAVVAVVRHPLGQQGPLVLQAASLAGIAAGTVIRFAVYRRWVFPEAAPEAAPDRRDGVSTART